MNSSIIPDKKRIFLWTLYDFANSLAFINLSFYFSLWLVTEQKKSDLWISATLALATIALLFTLPVFGKLSDASQRKMPYLRIFTLASIISLFALGLVAIKAGTLSTASVFLVATFYFLFQYFYQGGFAFYHSFLPELSGTVSREKVSGWGIAAGQLGNVVGLSLALPFATGKISLFGATGRPVTFLVAAIIFLVFSLPVLIFLKDKRKPNPNNPVIKRTPSLKEVWADLRSISRYPGVLRYLFSYYFFADASLTALLFGSLYLEIVAKLNDSQKTMVGIVALLFMVLGGLLGAKIAQTFKSTRKGLGAAILFLAAVLALFSFAFNQILFILAVILNGFGFGVIFTLSRAFYSQLIPQNQQAKFFSVYVLFERFASVVGPLLWSSIILIFTAFDLATRYRLAMFSLALLLIVSFLILSRMKEPAGSNA